MAIPVGTIKHEEVVPGPDAFSIHVLGEGAVPSCRDFSVFRLLAFRLGRFPLAGRRSHGVLPPYAMTAAPIWHKPTPCPQPAPRRTKRPDSLSVTNAEL